MVFKNRARKKIEGIIRSLAAELEKRKAENELKHLLIITKDSGQSQKFIRELPKYIEDNLAEISVEFAFYPDYEEKATQKDWTAIGLSPELLAENKVTFARLKELGVIAPIKNIRGVHFGLRRYDLIFEALLGN